MITFIFKILFLVTTCFAQSSTDVTVEGVVVKFDEKLIQLKQDNGAVIEVPRSSKKKLQGIKLGHDRITVKVSSVDFLKLNHKDFGLPAPSVPASSLKRK